MTPGIEVSIYGQRLGPKTGCTAGTGGWTDVKQLCGTAVTLDGVPAGLLYVQVQQINLRVPYNAPTEGNVTFVVTTEGHAGTATAVRFSPYRVAIEHSGEAYVGMPIWIEIQAALLKTFKSFRFSNDEIDRGARGKWADSQRCR